MNAILKLKLGILPALAVAICMVGAGLGQIMPAAAQTGFLHGQQQSYQSGWVQLNNARARLVTGSQALNARIQPSPTGAQRLAGLQIKLDPNWKTYWRSPGDSGVPPQFDWSGSQNVKKVDVLWPAPARYVEKYATTIGYKDEVVLPLIVHVKDPAKPAELKLKLFLGICEDICVPVNTALKHSVPAPGAAANPEHKDSLLAHFLRLVPQKVKAGPKAGLTQPLGVKSVTLSGGADAPRLLVVAIFPKGAKRRELYAEAGPATYLPQPVALEANAGNERVTRFAIDLSRSGGAAALKGKTVKLTLVSDAGQGEVDWPIK